MSARDLDALEEARANAALAKARMHDSVGALKNRLKPANLAASAMGSVRRKTDAAGLKMVGTMRKRPAATTVVAGLAAFVLLRKPLARLARRLACCDRTNNPDAAARTPASASAKQE